MLIRQGKWKGSCRISKEQNAGIVKLAVLLSLAAFLVFLIFAVGVQQTKAAVSDCDTCHGDPHGPGWQGCATCHGNPPATASHIKHFGATTLVAHYGDTSITQDFAPNNMSNYQMGCGNCHPLDPAKHKNGIVEIELYNASAPEGSLKARNPEGAAYTPGSNFTPTFTYNGTTFSYSDGSCSSVYCHSYNDWTTPLTEYTDQTLCQNNGFRWTSGACYGVPEPWTSPALPTNIVTTRYYQTPVWGGESLTCSGCHGNPPKTDYYTNDGGSGDSHAYLDRDGYEDLHGWNMGQGWPVSCTTCHNDTVGQLNTWTYGILDEWWDVSFYSNVSIGNYSKHVNGTTDVAFDKIRNLDYTNFNMFVTLPANLSSATYDSDTKTCSNVSCHVNQTAVTWGLPYRYGWGSVECNRCHGY